VDAFLSHLGLLGSQNILLACLVVYAATIFFGNIAAFTSLWIAFEGSFGPWGVLLVLVAMTCAGLTGDTLWFSLGRLLRKTRVGRWMKNRIPNHEKIEQHLEQNGRRWMLFGKFAYGSNVPVIFSIGWSGMVPFRVFFRNSLLAVSIWLPVLLGVSYALHSGLAPLASAVRTVRDLEVLFLVALVLFILVQYGLAKVVERVFKGKSRI
jgi:membrane protein DedA with SNARE-associated domain